MQNPSSLPSRQLVSVCPLQCQNLQAQCSCSNQWQVRSHELTYHISCSCMGTMSVGTVLYMCAEEGPAAIDIQTGESSLGREAKGVRTVQVGSVVTSSIQRNLCNHHLLSPKDRGVDGQELGLYELSHLTYILFKRNGPHRLTASSPPPAL